MGVKDLWQLLSPVGRRVSIETLEGKTLAIDMSIWLTQFIKAMRDEEGKMLKNAHILGTLRRILKLLHHRIRPVFVFDGATPALKLRVVQNRRKNHERQESNRRAAVHKLILAQLKKQLINPSSSSTTTAPTTTASQLPVGKSPSSNFAAGFVAPSSSSSSSTAANKQQTTVEVIDNLEQPPQDFGWTDGSDLPKPKSILEETNDNDEDEEEQIFDLPEDNQLDIEALSSLPSHIRKRIIEDARRRERMRSRATYIPVADNPALYSQTQLANFLSTSKLNRRFDEAQKRIDGSVQTGIKIASEGSKKYLYLSRGDLRLPTTATAEDAEEWLRDSNSDTKEEKEVVEDEESDVEFTDQDWINTTTVPSSSSAKRTLASNSNNHQNKPNKKRHRLLKKTVVSEVVDITGAEQQQEAAAREEENEGYFSPQYNYPDSPAAASPTIAAAAAAAKMEVELTEVIDITQQQTEEQQQAAVDDDRLANIEWEADDDDDQDNNEEDEIIMIIDPSVKSSGKHEEDSTAVERVDRDYYMDNDDNEDLAWIKENAGNSQAAYYADRVGNSEQQLISPSASLLAAPVAASSSSSSNKKLAEPEAIQRAVATASGMGDWAGRAVRRVMKEHFASSTNASSSSSAAVAAALKTEEIMKAVDEAIVATDLTGDDDNDSSSAQPPVDLTNMPDKSSMQAAAHRSPTQARSFEPRHSTVAAAAATTEENGQDIDIEATKKSLHTAARDSERVTEEMKHDVIQLIQAFNLPYIIAPFEAEAQCAVLEELGLVDGVITEDSDAFLFGAQAVYKNIFNDRKFVEVYLAEDAKRELGIAREDFIALAFFLGSDYTEGVNGIGIVNAMEIIQAFPMFGGPLEGLQRFKQWLDGYDFAKEILDELQLKQQQQTKKAKTTTTDRADDAEEELLLLQELTDPEQRLIRFDNKHRTGRAKWTVPGNFPDVKVAQAYFHPETNRSDQPFAWQQPVRSKARAYCKEVLGWTDNQLDLQLDPVLQRYAERSTQTRIDSHYMTYHDNTRFAKIASERLRSAVVQITGKKTNLALGMVKKSKSAKPVTAAAAAAVTAAAAARSSASEDKQKEKMNRKRSKKKKTSAASTSGDEDEQQEVELKDNDDEVSDKEVI